MIYAFVSGSKYERVGVASWTYSALLIIIKEEKKEATNIQKLSCADLFFIEKARQPIKRREIHTEFFF